MYFCAIVKGNEFDGIFDKFIVCIILNLKINFPKYADIIFSKDKQNSLWLQKLAQKLLKAMRAVFMIIDNTASKI